MSTITKDELIKTLITKTGKDKKYFDKLYKECSVEVETRVSENMTTKEKDAMTLRIFHAKVKRDLKSNSDNFTGVILGFSDVVDYGANNIYNKHKEVYENDPEQAIEDGYVDAEGHPLFLTPEWKKGKKIDLAKEKYRKVYLIAKKEGDADYKNASLVLNNDKLDIDLPLFQKVSFRANPSKTAKEDALVLYQAAVTEFVIIEEKRLDFTVLAKKYLKDRLCKIKNLDKHLEKCKDEFDKLVITKGNCSRINIGDNTNIIELDDISLEFNDDKASTLTCWSHKALLIQFSEYAPDVVVFGRLSYNDKKDEYQINALSFYVADEWMNKPAKEIKEEQAVQIKEEQPVEEKEELVITEEDDSEDDSDVF